MKLISKISLFFVLLCFSSFPQNSNLAVQTGADQLISNYLFLLNGKNVGLVTNKTGVLSNGTYLVDTLSKIKNVNVVALFGPEHGIRGDNPAGAKVGNTVDAKTGIPVYSLYGKNHAPTKEMLKNVDVLVYDIQDVGARFYTYISTLYYVLQAGAENNIPVIVLDRPNPINGKYVDGPIRTDDLKSFVGIAPIPIAYGLTPGELAQMYIGEGWLGKDIKPILHVIRLKNWKRSDYYDQTSLPWIVPSPNIPDLETALVYPGMCLIEGTNVSEGRGTMHPFLTIGAPYINPVDLIKELKKLDVRGVELYQAHFKPHEIPKMSTNPKYKDIKCGGIAIRVTNREELQSVKFGIKLIYALHKLYPDNFKFRDSGFDRLSGDKSIREEILKGTTPNKIISLWQQELNNFKQTRHKYLLY